MTTVFHDLSPVVKDKSPHRRGTIFGCHFPNFLTKTFFSLKWTFELVQAECQWCYYLSFHTLNRQFWLSTFFPNKTIFLFAFVLEFFFLRQQPLCPECWELSNFFENHLCKFYRPRMQSNSATTLNSVMVSSACLSEEKWIPVWGLVDT